MAKILIVEDDEDLCQALHSWLKNEHHTVESTMDGGMAEHLLKTSSYDILIVDWDLPSRSGIEICKTLRSGGSTMPILMLTGKSSLGEKEIGFDAGADDYLTKPFNLKEVPMRVKALLRRAHNYVNTTALTVRDIELEPDKYRVTKAGQDLRLLPKEFALLEFLMRNPNKVFSTEALLDRVWVSDADSSSEAVATCVRRLRRKVEVDGDRPLIVTVNRVGYKLDP